MSSEASYRIGVVQDWMVTNQPCYDQYDMTRLAFDEAFASGLIDRPVELIIREVNGAPFGQMSDVFDAWKDCVDQGCIAIIGPFISDACQAMRTTINEAKMPTLSYCATMHFGGDYCYQIPNGTFPDEMAVVAEHLDRLGCKTTAILQEHNLIGYEYAEYFKDNCERLGIRILAKEIMPEFMTREIALDRLYKLRQSGAESLLYVGYGAYLTNVVANPEETFHKWDWNIPRVSGTTWVAVTCPGIFAPWSIKDAEGWAALDSIHEDNKVFTAVLDRFEKRHPGRRPFHCYASLGYDIGNTLALALSRAPSATPEGVKQALDSIRLLPAASGGPGTVISFGPYDRRGLRGPQYLVLRTVRNGKEMAVPVER